MRQHGFGIAIYRCRYWAKEWAAWSGDIRWQIELAYWGRVRVFSFRSPWQRWKDRKAPQK